MADAATKGAADKKAEPQVDKKHEAEKREPLVSKQDVKTLAGPAAWRGNILAVLFTESEIQRKVGEMAEQINKEYAGRSIIVVGLLKGAFVFCADLVRRLSVPYQLDFMAVSSYGHGRQSSGNVRLKKDLDIDPRGQHILICEDLIDTGTTLAWIQRHLASKECASVRIACLLDKRARRVTPITIDFFGWVCPDEFVIGYGMDYAENYRCLPYGVLRPDAYNAH